MGAKEWAAALPDLQRKRAEMALAALTDEEPMSGAARLAAALDVLAQGVIDEAALAETHKPKAWQSAKATLLATGGKLRDLAREQDQIEGSAEAVAGNRLLRDPGRGIEPGGDPNQPGVAERNPNGFVYREPSDAEIAEHAERLAAEALAATPGVPDLSAIEAMLDEPAADETGGIPMLSTQQQIEAGLAVTPTSGSLAIFTDPKTTIVHDAHMEARQMLADRREQAPDVDPFTDPVTPAALAQPLTFADLMRPIHRADLPHWSHSQLATLSDCGVKYAATKLLKMPQIPQWSLVGGRAVHRAIETVERDIFAALIQVPHADPGNVSTIWNTAFSAVIAEVGAEAPVPPAQWRASNKGAEGFDWWRVEGEAMLARYVELRRKLIDAAAQAGQPPRQLLQVVDLPILEAELKIDVHGPLGAIPFVAVLDQAWSIDNGAGVLIVDVKTGRIPTDTSQLGSQALVLAQHMGLPDAELANQVIEACFYDARKGIYTPAFRPIERHPYAQLQYEVHTAEHYRRQGIYRPHTGPFCGGCSAKYACPVMNGAGK
jgi:hypothetical protein